jgi:FkbM family methyltransferase
MKYKLKKVFHKIGFGVCRWNYRTRFDVRNCKLLRNSQVATVIDVGANVGQFGEALRKNGYIGKIISIEPVRDSHRLLLEKAKSDKEWIVLPPMAIGDISRNVTINKSNNSQSSSILNFAPSHFKAAPDVVMVGTETVVCKKLDDLWSDIAPYIKGGLMLKLDVQGYEKRVLEGARCTLDKIDIIQLEVSTVPMYEGEDDWIVLSQNLKDIGFKLVDAAPVVIGKDDGKVMQWDMVFSR